MRYILYLTALYKHHKNHINIHFNTHSDMRTPVSAHPLRYNS